MVNHLETSSQPAPMLEKELSQDTLDAIKAIVSDGTRSVSTERINEAIKGSVAPSEVPSIEKAAEPFVHTKTDPVIEPESQSNMQANKEPAEPQDEGPEVEIELIRETVALAEEEAADALEDMPRAPEEEIIRPPSAALRLKRHLRNKIRMHYLIVKMKLRDRLPTKKELIRSLTPRRLAFAALVAMVLIRPWFFLTALMIILFFGTFVLLLMGPDRVWHYADLIWRRYKRLNPKKAEALQTRVMRNCEKWQSRMDRLPSRWTRGVQLPQFQSEAEKSAAESAYVDRMSRIAREERPKSYS